MFIDLEGKINQANEHLINQDNEGWPGYTVTQVREKAQSSIPKYQPSVILINVGTNDGQTGGADQAPNNMEALLDTCFEESPGTVVLLSTLLPNGNAPDAIEQINRGYREIVARRQSQGQKILLAELDDGFITIHDVWDEVHPTVGGAKKMAAVWYDGIKRAEEKGWLQAPNEIGLEEGATSFTCDKTRGSGNFDPRGSPQILFAYDSNISDDGDYKHASRSRGAIHTDDHGAGRNYFFTQVLTHEAFSNNVLDEIIRMGNSSASAEMAINNGNGAFGGFVKIDVGFDCKARGVRWGDVNGDGLDDFICVTTEGELLVSIDRGTTGNVPSFEYLGIHKLFVGSGYKQENVRLGDIDGDGRLDYCVIGSDDGHVRCWRNGGIGDKAAYWQDLGEGSPVFYAQGMGDIRGVRFADVNGE